MISERARRALERHVFLPDPVADAKALLFEVLDPTPDRGDMLYRCEHSLRAAAIGAAIARAEGLHEEALTLACVLHDIGYRDCLRPEDFRRHQELSAEIAQEYLVKIGYDPALSAQIVRGVALHNLTDSLPADMTPLEISVRDSDDIDRAGMIRTAMVLGRCVHEKTNAQILAECRREIGLARRFSALPRGTATARRMIEQRCGERIALLEAVMAQAKD